MGVCIGKMDIKLVFWMLLINLVDFEFFRIKIVGNKLLYR